MKNGRPVWAASAVVACSLTTLSTLAAQTGATMDLGVTDVRYDGFLPSAAASVSPEFRLERPHVLVWARGTYLQFESGRHSMQVNTAASMLSGPWRGLRAEISGRAGVSRYFHFESFSHLLATPRLHLVGDRQGAWVGGTVGSNWLGGANRPVTALETGTWARRFGINWLLGATNTHVGDTVYTDFQSEAHARRGRFTFDGSLGVRAWSKGGGHGVYGEASGGVALNPWLSIIASGGRYPTDPTSGSVSGRYFGIAFRMTALPRRPSSAVPLQPSRASHHSAPDPPDPPVAASVELRDCHCTGMAFVIHAPGATLVEVTGDFTNWEPVRLTPADAGAWTAVLPLSRGSYRFNVRIDGGTWIVPQGVSHLADEFGGEVGLLRVP